MTKSGSFRILLRPVSFSFRFLGAPVLLMLSYVCKPHFAALAETGIRVVAPENYINRLVGDDFNDVYVALMYLRSYAADEYERLRKEIRLIILWPKSGKNTAFGRICVLTPQDIPSKYSPQKRAIKIAGMLAYLSCQASYRRRLGFFYADKEIEVMIAACRAAQDRVLKLLSASIETAQPL